VALAAEEAHEPHRTIPRGLVWAQLTLIALVILTWLFTCGALDSQDLAVDVLRGDDGKVLLDDKGDPKTKDVDYPLLKTMGAIPVGRASPVLFYGFGVIAIFGIVASYHGMVFGASRQSFALGRAGYLPAFLGEVHATRRTPVPALLTGSVVTGGCVVASLWFPDIGTVAVLVSTLTALVWYILAMVSLFVLRRREPQLFRTYRAPVYVVLPVTVVLLSLFAAVLFGRIYLNVLPLTGALYAAGLGYYVFWARGRLRRAAPEELAARQAHAPEGGTP